MKRAIILIVLILGLGYCFLLWKNASSETCDAMCRVTFEDGTSAAFVDYTFEIESVGNVKYNYVIGERFIAREGSFLIGSESYYVGNKAKFKLKVTSFQIKNHMIFPFRLFFISKKNDDRFFLIGMK